MKRVVVTGMGMVTPLGCGVALNWEAMMAAEAFYGFTRANESMPMHTADLLVGWGPSR